MAIEIVTKEDLQIFKTELLSELQLMINSKTGPTKKWLRSPEVRKLLNISLGTLQNLRINGTLKTQKIGGIIYYDYSEIDSVSKLITIILHTIININRNELLEIIF